MNGLIGKKVGMTSIFYDNGQNVACTVVEAGPCVITQIKTEDTDGYNSFQIGFGSAKTKNTSRALQGHFAQSKSDPLKRVVEFKDFDVDGLISDVEGEAGLAKSVGDTISASEVFEEGEEINVVGQSKGKGFQGVVKRHGFAGVNDATHGQHNRQRAPGSIGAASDPAKVFKGTRMAGRTGGSRVKIKNLEIVKILPEKNLVLIKGAIPGHKGSFVVLEKR
ncbi:MAG: 50S ribosomal protein L3 [Flavobacteriales bacterium]|nr:50S ribosomal protein L3 [Flavobacteriales bacterium]